MGTGFGTAWLARGLLLIGLVAGGVIPSTAADRASLVGTVRDVTGNLLPGVEVLIATPAAAALPVATATSDPRGRFSIAGLLPGFYRVAALKAGYTTFVGQVNTRVQDSLQLVLHPAPVRAADGSTPPESPSWSLRLPRRGILRELDAPRELMRAQPPPDRRPADSVQVQVDQSFGVGAPLDSGPQRNSQLSATETAVRVASWIRDRTRVSVEGRRQSLGAEEGSVSSASTATERASSLTLGLDYDPGPADALALRAFYNRQGYRLSDGTPVSSGMLEQEHRVWGCDAGWSRQLDETKRLMLGMDYRDASFEAIQPGGQSASGSPGGEGLTNRAIGVQGAYEQRVGGRHEVQVAVGAQVSRWPGGPGRPGDIEPRPDGETGRSDWNLEIHAQDSLWLAVPLRLVYGVGARQALLSSDNALFAPNLGAIWEEDGWRVSARVSYNAVTDRDEPDPARGISRPPGPFGYEATIVAPLGEGIDLAGSAVSSPADYSPLGAGGGAWGGEANAFYLTDGAAAVREGRLALVEARGATSTRLELTRGRVDGTLAVILPFDGGFQPAQDGRLRFVGVRLGVGSTLLGADLQLDYRKVAAEGPQGPRTVEDSQLEVVDLRVRKTLPGLRVPGDWRMLLGLRLGSMESSRLQRWETAGGDPDAVVALNRRVSLGVSVLF